MVSTAPERKDPADRNEERITFLRIVVLLLGLAVGISIPIEILLVTRDGGKTVVQAPQAAAGSMAGMAGMTAAGAAATPSFAGAAPENADALAAAHKPYDAALPPLRTGDVVNVNLVLKDITVQIAPGVKYAAWACGRRARPGDPRAPGADGQDHADEQGCDSALRGLPRGACRARQELHRRLPRQVVHLQLQGERPGVFMYHCGTKPVLMHIANGMYGAIVVEPSTPLPHADKQYVLVASEWNLDRNGLTQPAQFDMAKAHGRRRTG